MMTQIKDSIDTGSVYVWTAELSNLNLQIFLEFQWPGVADWQ